MLDIVGARFHCAICDDVDICSNCESAGLPGNLDDDDGGHSSSHIMIKVIRHLIIILTLTSPLIRFHIHWKERRFVVLWSRCALADVLQLQTASKRAMHLWKGRDGPSVLSDSSKKKAASEFSSYARTVVANGSHRPSGDPSEDHHIPCSACNQVALVSSYLRACTHDPTADLWCPLSVCTLHIISYFSKPGRLHAFLSILSLTLLQCASCEERSYLIHDPYHVFIKIPRPVDFPLEEQGPILPRVYSLPIHLPLLFLITFSRYKQPAGSVPGMEGQHPLTYLRYLAHTNAVCDRCVQPIRGCWYRCAYCGMDLCDACEVNDTHNDAHVFIVFKAPVSVWRNLEHDNFADTQIGRYARLEVWCFWPIHVLHTDISSSESLPTSRTLGVPRSSLIPSTVPHNEPLTLS